jgi:hypothetical protein
MPGGLVDIKVNKAQMERVRRLLKGVPGGMPTVMSRAINKTAASARTEIVRGIAAQVKLKQSDIRKATRVTKATRRVWQAFVDVLDRRIPLIKFGARQTKKGVSYVVEKGGPRKLIETAFIETMPSGHRGVFRRYRPTTPRLPIIELFGPSIGNLFEGAKDIYKHVMRSSQQKLSRNIDYQVELLLKKRGAK